MNPYPHSWFRAYFAGVAPYGPVYTYRTYTFFEVKAVVILSRMVQLGVVVMVKTSADKAMWN